MRTGIYDFKRWKKRIFKCLLVAGIVSETENKKHQNQLCQGK